MAQEMTAFQCSTIGVSGTTQVFVRRQDDRYVARVGICLLGSINMKEEELRNANPFDDSFRDNYAEGEGASSEEAIENLKKDIGKISESLWI